MVEQEEKNITKENEQVLDLFSQATWSLQSDHDLLKESHIETGMAQFFRKLVSNPKEGIMEIYLTLDDSIKNAVIGKLVNTFILKNSNVKSAKCEFNDSIFKYYLLLNDDTDEGREDFYNVSYSFLESDLSNKFRLCFNFLNNPGLLKKVGGDSLK